MNRFAYCAVFVLVALSSIKSFAEPSRTVNPRGLAVSTALKAEREFPARIEALAEYSKHEKSEEMMRLLQFLLDDPKVTLANAIEEKTRYVGHYHRVAEILQGLKKETREFYEFKYQKNSETAYKEATDASQWTKLVLQMPETNGASRALRSLGYWHLDRGRCAHALPILEESLKDKRLTEKERLHTLLTTSIAASCLGRKSTVDKYLTEFYEFQKRPGVRDTKTAALKPEQIKEEMEKWEKLGMSEKLPTIAKLPADESELAGESLVTHSHVAPGENSFSLNLLVPQVIDDILYYRTSDRIAAFDLKKKEKLWSRARRETLSDFATYGMAQAYEDFHVLTSFAVNRDLLVAVERESAPTQNAMPGQIFTRLSAYGAKSGLLRWEIDSFDVNEKHEIVGGDVRFTSTPIFVDKYIYVLAQASGKLFLLRINSTYEGKIEAFVELGEQFVQTTTNGGHQSPRVHTDHLTWRDGHLYVHTADGTFMDIDGKTLSLRWARTEKQWEAADPESAPRRSSAWNAAPVFVGDQVILQGRSTERNICLDLGNGKTKWQVPAESLYLLAGENLVYSVNAKSISALDVKSGKVVWRNAMGIPSGKATLIENRLFAPTGNEIAILDAKVGNSKLRVDVSQRPGTGNGSFVFTADGMLMQTGSGIYRYKF